MPYLEISPRATGKTFRLIEEVARTVSCNQKVNIFANESVFKDIKEKIGKKVGDKIHLIEFKGKGGRRFFDEFDFLDLDDLVVRDTDYFCGTIRFQRILGQIPEQDILFKLFQATGSKCESFYFPVEFQDPKIINYGRDAMGQNFKTEYCNQIFK